MSKSLSKKSQRRIERRIRNKVVKKAAERKVGIPLLEDSFHSRDAEAAYAFLPKEPK